MKLSTIIVILIIIALVATFFYIKKKGIKAKKTLPDDGESEEDIEPANYKED